MRLPTKEEEAMHKIEYTDYSSPDLENPSRGFLGAAAVRMLAPYVRNAVLESPGSIIVHPPYIIPVPPIQQYAFIPVTGRIVARTVAPANPSYESPAKKVPAKANAAGSSSASSSAAASAGGPGSQLGSKEPKTPKNTGKIIDNDEAEAEEEEVEEEEEDDGEEDEDGEGLESELAQLEAMEAGGKPKAKGKAGKKKPGAAPKGGAPKKKSRKSSA